MPTSVKPQSLPKEQEPQLLNLVEVETPSGSRVFELWNGDISCLCDKADIVVFSAHSGTITPTPGTVIRALKDKFSLDIGALAAKPEYDFTSGLGCWVSSRLSGMGFGRLLCVEVKGASRSIEQVVEDLFVVLSVLEMKQVPIRTVVLPILGTGRLHLDPKVVTPLILGRALEYMKRSRTVEKLVFVEANRARAMQLDEAMDAALARHRLVLPRGPLVSTLRQELFAAIDALHADTEILAESLLIDLRRVVASEVSRSFEIGIVGRRLAELVANHVTGAFNQVDLYAKVENMSEHGVAPWIRSYLHVLRVFGNEAAHERSGDRTPRSINEADLALCLFCLLRTLSFFMEWRAVKG